MWTGVQVFRHLKAAVTTAEIRVYECMPVLNNRLTGFSRFTFWNF